MKFKEKVIKQYSVSFLEIVDYLDLLANVALVTKKDGKVWVWVVSISQ